MLEGFWNIGRNYDLIYPPVNELWGACVIYPAIAPRRHAVMQSLKGRAGTGEAESSLGANETVSRPGLLL